MELRLEGVGCWAVSNGGSDSGGLGFGGGWVGANGMVYQMKG